MTIAGTPPLGPLVDFCGCCEVAAPLSPMAVTNRPGLTRIQFRVGDYASFRQTMLEGIAAQPRLAGLTTRNSTDYSITLVELFSAMGDVLTFYNERIANEIFLRSARERDSVRRLVGLIGYRPRPGLAATTLLSFQLDPDAVTPLNTGLKVMSIPGPGERAHTYETTEDLVADARLNAVPMFMPPIPINPLGAGRDGAPILARPALLSPGDRLLLFNADRLEVREIAQLTARPDAEHLRFSPPLDAAFPVGGGIVMKQLRSLNLFAHDVPDSVNSYDAAEPQVEKRWKKVAIPISIPAGASSYPLDRKLDDLKPGSWLLVDRGSGTQRYQLMAVVDTEDASASVAPDRSETVTHVTVRETIRGEPIAIAVAGASPRIIALSGTGLVTDLSAAVPAIPLAPLLATARPAGAMTAAGRVDLVARGGGGGTQHAVWTAAGWSPWADLGGIATSPPALVADGAGSIWLFVRGTDCALWSKRLQGGTWGTWHSLGGILTSGPVAVSAGPGLVDVFARGEDRALWRLERTAAGWKPWRSLEGRLAGTPAALATQPGALDLAILDPDGCLLHRRLRDGRWSAWTKLNGQFADRPELVRTGPAQIAIFARGGDGTVTQLESNGESWADPVRLDGPVASPVSVAVDPAVPGLVMTARLPTGVMGQAARNDSQPRHWSQWSPSGGVLGAIADRRRTRLFEVDPAEIVLRNYDYPAPNVGARFACRADHLDALARNRRLLLDDGRRRHVRTVAASRIALGLIEDPHLIVDLDSPIGAPMDAITMNGNLAAASHGETPNPPEEPLGHGDAARAFQSFNLRRSPVTRLPSESDLAGQAALEVRVNGERWKEAASFYGRGPNDRIYTLRHNDEGEAAITFGDGRTGARVPTGAMNVIAKYRTGLGLAGRVKADQLSIALERPVGLRSVTNPLPAEGGADPEPLEAMRVVAPTTVRTFRRAISIDDFAAIATTSGLISRAAAIWVWVGLEKAIHVTVAAQEGTALSANSLRALHEAMGRSRDPNHPLMLGNVCRVPIVLRAKLLRSPDYKADDVLAAGRAAIERFLAFDTMDFARSVHLSDLFAVLQGATGVVAVDIDQFHLKGHGELTAAQLQLRSVTAEPVQKHVRIHSARPTPADPALVDPITRACFPDGILPPVLPAEQVCLADPTDAVISVVDRF